MPDDIYITIPFNFLVSVNDRLVPQGGKGAGRLVLSTKYRDRHRSIHMLALAQRGSHRPDSDTCWRLTLRFFDKADQYKRDAHNYVKIVADALEDAIYDDDFQVKVIQITHCGDAGGDPRMDVIAIPLEEHGW